MQGLIVYLHKGKAQGYYVPKEIAEIFEANPIDAMVTSQVLRAISQPFKTIFTGINPGFQLFNLHRDFFRALTILPKANIRKFLPEYMQAIKPAFKSVFGIPTDVTNEMLKGNMLISVAEMRVYDAEDAQIDRMLRSYHILSPVWKNKLIKPLSR